MDITKLSLQELKALAYDHLVELEKAKLAFNAIQSELSKKEQELNKNEE